MNHKIKRPHYLKLLLVALIYISNVINGVAQTKTEDKDWKQLFNGKDLTGWKHVGGGSRFVEDGLLATLKLIK